MISISNKKPRRLKLLGASLLTAMALSTGSGPALAGGDVIHFEKQNWSFGGIFGTYDRAQLRRGFQVYSEVCAGCHSMDLLSYRNLGEKGGPEFSEEEVKKIAAEVEIMDGPNQEGEMFERKAKPSDRFKAPFANAQAARSSNGGALPPDLSVITRARNVHGDYYWFMAPFVWLKDIATAYQEGGADYLYGLLSGYKETPTWKKDAKGRWNKAAGGEECVSVNDGECSKLAEGMSYNAAFPGHQIAMANPLDDDAVEYADGTKATADNHVRDITAFLMWAADPHRNTRKALGLWILLYLAGLGALLYFVKQRIWSDVKH